MGRGLLDFYLDDIINSSDDVLDSETVSPFPRVDDVHRYFERGHGLSCVSLHASASCVRTSRRVVIQTFTCAEPRSLEAHSTSIIRPPTSSPSLSNVGAGADKSANESEPLVLPDHDAEAQRDDQVPVQPDNHASIQADHGTPVQPDRQPDTSWYTRLLERRVESMMERSGGSLAESILIDDDHDCTFRLASADELDDSGSHEAAVSAFMVSMWIVLHWTKKLKKIRLPGGP